MLLFATAVAVRGNENNIDDKKIDTCTSDTITLFPLLNGKMAYGQAVQATTKDLVTFDLDAPNPWTIIGPGVPPAVNFLSGGDFIEDVWYACEYSTTNSNIWTIDETTGTMTLVGASNALLNGIAYDDSTTTLYGVSSTSLYTINIATGIATLIGAMGNVGGIMIGIASDGQGNLYGEDIGDDNLYSINTGTGAATIIGPLDVNLNYAQDMAIDKEDGTCYITGYKGSTAGGGALMWVNLTTGHATLIANFPDVNPSVPAEVDCFAIPYMTTTNNPPVTPTAPAGPASGKVGVSYSFTASTTDPEGDNISYMFDWGDGNNSGWLGPFASGAIATGTYTWNAVGTYNITVKAKDTIGAESGVSPAHTIVISPAGPTIEIEAITGGLFKVKTSVKNTGTETVTNINWSIKLDGGLILLGKETTGTITGINAGGSIAISSKMILGFGATTITVTADTVSKTQDAKVLLIFVKIL